MTRNTAVRLFLIVLAACFTLSGGLISAQTPGRTHRLELKLLKNNGGVRVIWDAPKSGTVDGYKIMRKVGTKGGKWAILVEDTDSTKTHYKDTTATTAGTRYYYRVRARNGNNEGPAQRYQSIELPGGAIPGKPRELTATGVSNGIRLNWKYKDKVKVDGFQILRRTKGTQWSVLVADTNNRNTYYTDTTAVAGTEYGYRVKARYGESNIGKSPPAEWATRPSSGG